MNTNKKRSYLKPKRLRTRKFLLLAFFVVVSVLVILKIALPQRADASWFDESWQYRKKINVASHTASENNVYVTTPTFDATDTSRFKSGCGNIRFTKENGEVLPYFVVACTASASMHVFFDTLPAGESNYYMYYGNTNAPNGNTATDFSTAATGLGSLALGTETAGPGPIAYWKFDEGTGTTANDSTPNSNTGTLTLMSSPPTSTSGWQTEDQCISGKCLGFDGSNDEVDVTSASSIDFERTNAFSVSFWARQTKTSAAAAIISKNTTATGFNGWSINTNQSASSFLAGSMEVFLIGNSTKEFPDATVVLNQAEAVKADASLLDVVVLT